MMSRNLIIGKCSVYSNRLPVLLQNGFNTPSWQVPALCILNLPAYTLPQGTATAGWKLPPNPGPVPKANII